MDRWIELKDKTRPRRGELIMVKSEIGIYPYLLIAEDVTTFWQYNKDDKAKYEKGHFSGVQLMGHGLTHWTLLESPY